MGNRSIKTKIVLYCISALLCTAITVQVASAWTFSPRVVLYTSGFGFCVKGEAGIDSAKPGVFSGNLAYSATFALLGDCGTVLTLPDGSAASRLDVHKWTGSEWVVCRSTDWIYGRTFRDEFGNPMGPGWVYNYGGASSCGAGYYSTTAYAYVWDGAAWRGGSVWSGYEYVQ